MPKDKTQVGLDVNDLSPPLVNMLVFDGIRNVKVRAIARSFLTNAQRTAAAIHGHGSFVFAGLRYGIAKTAAHLELAGKPFPELDEWIPHQADATYRLISEILSGQRPMPPGYDGAAITPDFYAGLFMDIAMRPVIETALVSAWTAFEVLAGDLWKASVDEFPILGLRAINAEFKASDSPAERDKKRAKTIEVPIHRAAEDGFDLRSRLGEILIDRFAMQSAKGIAAAHAAVFGQQAGEIARDRDLRALAAVRNSIVHRGSVADSDTIRQLKNHDGFVAAADGEPLPLMPRTATKLIQSSQTQGEALIKLVDDYWSSPT